MTKLGDIIDTTSGKAIRNVSNFGKYPVYGSNGIIGYSDDYQNERAVIIGRVGAYCGSIYLCDAKFWPSDNTIIAKPKTDNNLYFINYLLKNLKLNNLAGGSAQPLLTQGVIKSFEIDKIFSENVQQKIASILSAYDDLIENNNKSIKILEEIMKSFYRKEFIENKKEEWKKTSLENCCKKIGSGSTPSRKKQEYWNNADIKWFKTKELSDGFLLDSEEKISNLGFENSSTKLFPKNTVLMAIYAAPTLGRLGVLTSDSTFNQAACGLLADETKLSTTFLFLKLLEMRDYFNMMAMGSAQQNISVEKVRTAEINLPSLDLIKKFDLVAKPIFDSILNLTRKNEVLSNLKNFLLPKLISGELDVKGLDIKIRPEIL